MRTVTIRESAFRACRAWGIGGDDILMRAIGQAFDDADPDPGSDYECALLEAIVPDIRDSLRDEGARPTGRTVEGTVRVTLDPDAADIAGAIADALAAIDRGDGGE